MLAGVYIKPKPNPAKNPQYRVSVNTLRAVMQRAKNVVDIKIPIAITGTNPNRSAKMHDIEAERQKAEECTDPIQATSVSLELKSCIIDPNSSPKLISIPVGIAFATNAEKQTNQGKTPSFL